MEKVWIKPSANEDDVVIVDRKMFVKFAKAALENQAKLSRHEIKQHVKEIADEWENKTSTINELQNDINDAFDEISFTTAVNAYVTDQERKKIEV